jgi:glutamine synthetase
MAIASDDPSLDGYNLLKPGKTPHQNIRFLVFLAAVLQAAHRHQGLLRASVAHAGNEHRLGANEAPPAIVSVFMGEMLTHVIEEIAAGRNGARSAVQAMITLGVAKLPEIEQDTTDRNRTSPLAFTGVKFEFRAVGGSQSSAFPVTILNATVAEALGELTERIREAMKTTPVVDDAVLAVVRESFRESAPIRFEGNNYSGEWVEEAARRGLLNLRRTPEALAQLVTSHARAALTGQGILTKEELGSRYHVRLERYVKDLLIELHTLREIVDTQVLPASLTYAGVLAEGAANACAAGITYVPQVAAANALGVEIERLQARRAALGEVIARAEAAHEDIEAQAMLLTSEGATCMADVRESCDALELMVADERWPLPKYRELLFPV